MKPSLLPSTIASVRQSGPQRVRAARALAGLFVGVIAASLLCLAAMAFCLEEPSRLYAFITAQTTEFDFHVPDGELATHYECIGWRRTRGGSPNGAVERRHDADCSTEVGDVSGFCLYRHRTTRATRRVLPLWGNSLSGGAKIRCSDVPELLAYGPRSLQYEHDASFAFARQRYVAGAKPSQALPLSRGITMVVHGGVLASAYASVRVLRQNGCSLPVEMWYRADELDPSHRILQELVANHNVIVREITDPLATSYYTKLFAVFYSKFDHVLLLDADNFAVRDPEYLFDSDQYKATGAIFWPDFWQPRQSAFNIHRHSLLWQVFGLPFVDMFEQESGQVLINRQRHGKALNTLMFYGFSQPRLPVNLHLVWGDKDLFRLAWMKTNSSFHYIARHVGSAGRLNTESLAFCGLTMVQHDPQGEIVFLHRNIEKLRTGDGNKKVWTHIQQFKEDAPLDKYSVSFAKVFEDLPGCWANAEQYKGHYLMTSIDAFAFRDIEEQMLRFAVEADAVARGEQGR